MDIQGLIQFKSKELGEKLIESMKTQEGIANMVKVIDDHLAESMKAAYQEGLSQKKALLVFEK